MKLWMNVLLAVALAAMFATPSSTYANAAPTFQSDDFNRTDISANGVWSVSTVPSISGQSITDNGTEAVIVAPPGPNQTIYYDQGGPSGQLVYNVPRLMQPFGGTVGDESFEMQALFTTIPDATQKYQQEGILLKGTADSEFLRFEFHSDGSTVNAYAVHLFRYPDGMHAPVMASQPIDLTGATSLTMQVSRAVFSWKMAYSINGGPFIDVPLTNTPTTFNVSRVGLYAGTSSDTGVDGPGFTAHVDEFLNMDAPSTSTYYIQMPMVQNQ